MKGSLPLRFFASAFALATLPAVCNAQTRSRVTVTRLKPEMTAEWVDLQRFEVVPAVKKAGIKSQTIYSTAIFGNANEYLTVQPFDTTGQFDGESPLIRGLDAARAARLGAKLAKCVVESHSYQITAFDELNNNTETPSPIIISVRYRIAQGKMQDYRDLMKSDVLPVYKKAKTYLRVSQRGPGGNPNDVTVVTGIKTFAEMNGGPFLAQQLGAEAAARLNAKFAPIRTTIEVVTRRRIADLSW